MNSKIKINILLLLLFCSLLASVCMMNTIHMQAEENEHLRATIETSKYSLRRV